MADKPSKDGIARVVKNRADDVRMTADVFVDFVANLGFGESSLRRFSYYDEHGNVAKETRAPFSHSRYLTKPHSAEITCKPIVDASGEVIHQRIISGAAAEKVLRAIQDGEIITGNVLLSAKEFLSGHLPTTYRHYNSNPMQDACRNWL